MKVKIAAVVAALLGATGLVYSIGYAQITWIAKEESTKGAEARAVAVGDKSVYMATKDALYQNGASDGSWMPIFGISGGNEINCVTASAGRIFVGTRQGLFVSYNNGKSWRTIFRSGKPERNDILCIGAFPGASSPIFIGTRSGIFKSADYGARWSDTSGALRSKAVRCIARAGDLIYAGTDNGIYASALTKDRWERLVVTSEADEDDLDDVGSEEGNPDEEGGTSGARCIAISEGRIYIGINKKILFSEDEGKSWGACAVSGLAGVVNDILPSTGGGRLYCATTKGIFEFVGEKGRWKELYRGTKKNINTAHIIFGDRDEKSLWAVTDSGLYKFESGAYEMTGMEDAAKSLKWIKAVFDAEPPFRELRQAAIRYAEVSPEKIRSWRREARLRALCPKVSFSKDTDRSTNSEIYTSATKDYVVVGPDDMSDGWGLSLSWELGDLVWADAQANIDVRSRLMVQLRNDILDDLRRIYYERKRIRYELMTEPPQDMKGLFEKEMRLEELTQAIDDLTGNYFTERMAKK